tara:strand:- start:543 stop:644 length:102 start_codon:yes stop_codon:yes gene_type:complete
MKSIEYWKHKGKFIPTHIKKAYKDISEWEKANE